MPITKRQIAKVTFISLSPHAFDLVCLSKILYVWLMCIGDKSAERRLNKINPFQNKPWFLRVCGASLWKALWEKEKLLIRSNFFFSHSVFYPSGVTFCHFHQIRNCRLQTLSVWKSLKFVVWERVKKSILSCYMYSTSILKSTL